MQPFGVLDRYIGKTIFTTIMMTLFMLCLLYTSPSPRD